MAITFFDRLKWSLAQCHARLAVLFGEGDGHERLKSALTFFLPCESEIEPLRRQYFVIDAANPKFVAVLNRAQTSAPLATGPHVAGDFFRGMTLRTEPVP